MDVTDGSRLSVVEYMGTQGTLSGLDFHVLTLCRHLDRSRVDLTLTCPVQSRNEDLVKEASEMGVRLYRLASEKRNPLSYLKRTLGLIRQFRRERVDVLHIHAGGFTGANALLAAWVARVPVIVVSHHSLFGLQPYSIGSFFSLLFEKRLATRIVMSHSEQVSEMASAGIAPHRLVIIPNGVNLAKFSFTDPVSKDQTGPLRLVMVARLIEGKGHEVLLRALHQVLPEHPDVRLTMVGDGPLKTELDALIAELGLGGAVERIGQVNYDDLPSVYAQAHAMVVPTYMPGEEFPTVLLEGMACGLPAIATRHRGIPDIVADGQTGLLVEPRNVEALAEAIRRLLSDRSLVETMSRRARARVEQNFTTEVFGRRMTELYRQVGREGAQPDTKNGQTLEPIPRGDLSIGGKQNSDGQL
jgi:glycosyltransferase involved in cell wall biosynthesis